jgi:hypothetical protein
LDNVPTTAPSPVSLGEAFKYWLKPGFISFGGPAGQIAMMHRNCWKNAAGFPNTAICTASITARCCPDPKPFNSPFTSAG